MNNISTEGFLLPWPKSGNTQLGNSSSQPNATTCLDSLQVSALACKAHQAFIRLHGAIALWLAGPRTSQPLGLIRGWKDPPT